MELVDGCSPIYGGPNAFSEAESSAIQKYLLGLPEPPALTVELHSFGNKLLYPYGYAKNTFPDNVDEILELAKKAASEVPGMEPINAADMCE